MKLTTARLLIISLIIAVIITVIPAFNPNIVPLNQGPHSDICTLMTTAVAGYPVKWVGYRYCGGYIFSYSITNAIVDLVFWFVIVAVVLFAVKYATKGNSKKTKRK